MVASDRRLALIREFEQPAQLTVHHLIAELYEGVDWVLVEGFKQSDLLKIEVWRGPSPAYAAPGALSGRRLRRAPSPPTPPSALPVPTGLPVLDVNDPDAIVEWLLDNADRFEYNAELYV